MRFILLGTASGMPDPSLNSSCLYVESNGKRFIFDCGEGCAAQLIRHGLDGEALDAVFISHYHPDHVSGLFMLLQMLYLQKRIKPLQLFLPERPAEMMELLQMTYTFPKRFSFSLNVFDCAEAELYHDEIRAQRNDHLAGYREFVEDHGLPHLFLSYSFRVSSPAGDLVYTSDLGSTDSVRSLVRDCHTAIVDALHPEAAQIIKLQYLGLRRVLLTHGISQQLRDTLSAVPVPLFSAARQDEVYEII